MPKGRIRELERIYPDLEQQIANIVNRYGEEGQKIAAEMMGVSQPTISTYLIRNGYKRIVRYVKQEQAS